MFGLEKAVARIFGKTGGLTRAGNRFVCYFMLGAQAPCAQVNSFWLAVYSDSSRVNIGQPAPFCVAL